MANVHLPFDVSEDVCKMKQNLVNSALTSSAQTAEILHDGICTLCSRSYVYVCRCYFLAIHVCNSDIAYAYSMQSALLGRVTELMGMWLGSVVG